MRLTSPPAQTPPGAAASFVQSVWNMIWMTPRDIEKEHIRPPRNQKAPSPNHHHHHHHHHTHTHKRESHTCRIKDQERPSLHAPHGVTTSKAGAPGHSNVSNRYYFEDRDTGSQSYVGCGTTLKTVTRRQWHRVTVTCTCRTTHHCARTRRWRRWPARATTGRPWAWKQASIKRGLNVLLHAGLEACFGWDARHQTLLGSDAPMQNTFARARHLIYCILICGPLTHLRQCVELRDKAEVVRGERLALERGRCGRVG